MDGKYSARGSVRRSTLAEAAASAGVPTRIIGFSWNAAPLPRARAALRRAAAAGAVPLLRDPVSARRARSDGIDAAVDVADIVFSAQSRDDRSARSLLGGY